MIPKMMATPLVCSAVRKRYYLALLVMALLVACSESGKTSYTPSNPIGVTYEPTAEWQRPEGGTTAEPEDDNESFEPTEPTTSVLTPLEPEE